MNTAKLSRADKARLAVLETAREDLDALNANSDYIRVDAVRQVAVKGWPLSQTPPGWPSELYKVTYSCTGFIGLHSTSGEPIRGDHHEMAMCLTMEYPGRPPKLAWMTPIWHPNIEHAGGRTVCTDEFKHHRSMRPLSELLFYIGEMIQYKQYHAKHEEPWPLDREVAKWVIEVAEPKGWVGRDRPIDTRSLVRAQEIRKLTNEELLRAAQSQRGGISFQRSLSEIQTENASSPPARAGGIRFGVDPGSLGS